MIMGEITVSSANITRRVGLTIKQICQTPKDQPKIQANFYRVMLRRAGYA